MASDAQNHTTQLQKKTSEIHIHKFRMAKF